MSIEKVARHTVRLDLGGAYVIDFIEAKTVHQKAV